MFAPLKKYTTFFALSMLFFGGSLCASEQKNNEPGGDALDGDKVTVTFKVFGLADEEESISVSLSKQQGVSLLRLFKNNEELKKIYDAKYYHVFQDQKPTAAKQKKALSHRQIMKFSKDTTLYVICGKEVILKGDWIIDKELRFYIPQNVNNAYEFLETSLEKWAEAHHLDEPLQPKDFFIEEGNQSVQVTQHEQIASVKERSITLTLDDLGAASTVKLKFRFYAFYENETLLNEDITINLPYKLDKELRKNRAYQKWKGAVIPTRFLLHKIGDIIPDEFHKKNITTKKIGHPRILMPPFWYLEVPQNIRKESLPLFSKGNILKVNFTPTLTYAFAKDHFVQTESLFLEKKNPSLAEYVAKLPKTIDKNLIYFPKRHQLVPYKIGDTIQDFDLDEGHIVAFIASKVIVQPIGKGKVASSFELYSTWGEWEINNLAEVKKRITQKFPQKYPNPNGCSFYEDAEKKIPLTALTYQGKGPHEAKIYMAYHFPVIVFTDKLQSVAASFFLTNGIEDLEDEIKKWNENHPKNLINYAELFFEKNGNHGTTWHTIAKPNPNITLEKTLYLYTKKAKNHKEKMGFTGNPVQKRATFEITHEAQAQAEIFENLLDDHVANINPELSYQQVNEKKVTLPWGKETWHGYLPYPFQTINEKLSARLNETKKKEYKKKLYMAVDPSLPFFLPHEKIDAFFYLRKDIENYTLFSSPMLTCINLATKEIWNYKIHKASPQWEDYFDRLPKDFQGLTKYLVKGGCFIPYSPMLDINEFLHGLPGQDPNKDDDDEKEENDAPHAQQKKQLLVYFAPTKVLHPSVDPTTKKPRLPFTIEPNPNAILKSAYALKVEIANHPSHGKLFPHKDWLHFFTNKELTKKVPAGFANKNLKEDIYVDYYQIVKILTPFNLLTFQLPQGLGEKKKNLSEKLKEWNSQQGNNYKINNKKLFFGKKQGNQTQYQPLDNLKDNNTARSLFLYTEDNVKFLQPQQQKIAPLKNNGILTITAENKEMGDRFTLEKINHKVLPLAPDNPWQTKMIDLLEREQVKNVLQTKLKENGEYEDTWGLSYALTDPRLLRFTSRKQALSLIVPSSLPLHNKPNVYEETIHFAYSPVATYIDPLSGKSTSISFDQPKARNAQWADYWNAITKELPNVKGKFPWVCNNGVLFPWRKDLSLYDFKCGEEVHFWGTQKITAHYKGKRIAFTNCAPERVIKSIEALKGSLIAEKGDFEALKKKACLQLYSDEKQTHPLTEEALKKESDLEVYIAHQLPVTLYTTKGRFDFFLPYEKLKNFKKYLQEVIEKRNKIEIEQIDPKNLYYTFDQKKRPTVKNLLPKLKNLTGESPLYLYSEKTWQYLQTQEQTFKGLLTKKNATLKVKNNIEVWALDLNDTVDNIPLQNNEELAYTPLDPPLPIEGLYKKKAEIIGWLQRDHVENAIKKVLQEEEEQIPPSFYTLTNFYALFSSQKHMLAYIPLFKHRKQHVVTWVGQPVASYTNIVTGKAADIAFKNKKPQLIDYKKTIEKEYSECKGVIPSLVYNGKLVPFDNTLRIEDYAYGQQVHFIYPQAIQCNYEKTNFTFRNSYEKDLIKTIDALKAAIVKNVDTFKEITDKKKLYLYSNKEEEKLLTDEELKNKFALQVHIDYGFKVNFFPPKALKPIRWFFPKGLGTEANKFQYINEKLALWNHKNKQNIPIDDLFIAQEKKPYTFLLPLKLNSDIDRQKDAIDLVAITDRSAFNKDFFKPLEVDISKDKVIFPQKGLPKLTLSFYNSVTKKTTAHIEEGFFSQEKLREKLGTKNTPLENDFFHFVNWEAHKEKLAYHMNNEDYFLKEDVMLEAKYGLQVNIYKTFGKDEKPEIDQTLYLNPAVAQTTKALSDALFQKGLDKNALYYRVKDGENIFLPLAEKANDPEMTAMDLYTEQPSFLSFAKDKNTTIPVALKLTDFSPQVITNEIIKNGKKVKDIKTGQDIENWQEIEEKNQAICIRKNGGDWLANAEKVKASLATGNSTFVYEVGENYYLKEKGKKVEATDTPYLLTKEESFKGALAGNPTFEEDTFYTFFYRDQDGHLHAVKDIEKAPQIKEMKGKTLFYEKLHSHQGWQSGKAIPTIYNHHMERTSFRNLILSGRANIDETLLYQKGLPALYLYKAYTPNFDGYSIEELLKKSNDELAFALQERNKALFYTKRDGTSHYLMPKEPIPNDIQGGKIEYRDYMRKDNLPSRKIQVHIPISHKTYKKFFHWLFWGLFEMEAPEKKETITLHFHPVLGERELPFQLFEGHPMVKQEIGNIPKSTKVVVLEKIKKGTKDPFGKKNIQAQSRRFTNYINEFNTPQDGVIRREIPISELYTLSHDAQAYIIPTDTQLKETFRARPLVSFIIWLPMLSIPVIVILKKFVPHIFKKKKKVPPLTLQKKEDKKKKKKEEEEKQAIEKQAKNKKRRTKKRKIKRKTN